MAGNPLVYAIGNPLVDRDRAYASHQSVSCFHFTYLIKYKSMPENKLPSQFQINEDVSFIPMFRQCQEMGIAPDELEGTVVAIKFTEAKVFYDIYSPYWGKIFDGVDSVKVSADNLLGVKLPSEN